jgi:hypothetical protein
MFKTQYLGVKTQVKPKSSKPISQLFQKFKTHKTILGTKSPDSITHKTHIWCGVSAPKPTKPKKPIKTNPKNPFKNLKI